jgi:hypothetical protein
MTNPHPNHQPNQQPDQQPNAVIIEVQPTGMPAHERPMSLISEVTQVLRAHGLNVQEISEHAQVLISLGRIVDPVAAERGGRRS